MSYRLMMAVPRAHFRSILILTYRMIRRFVCSPVRLIQQFGTGRVTAQTLVTVLPRRPMARRRSGKPEVYELSQNEWETVGDGLEEEEDGPEPLRLICRSTISRMVKKPTSQSPPGKRSGRTGKETRHHWR